MSKVFVGGSRRITRLSPAVCDRIANIVEKRFPILVGDASGADKAVQTYLHDQRYESVEVFCSDQTPRNNVGHWPLRVIRPAESTRDFDYFATKDRAMASEATIGLMLWDGKSRGTPMNVLRLIAQEKLAVVYLAPKRTFANIRSHSEFARLLQELDSATHHRLLEQATREGLGRMVEQGSALIR